MDLLISILAFAFTIAVLVTFHEFGHFWVARRCGVKILTFSVGFGKPLWQRTGRDGVNYQLAAIPLGGYVKMYGHGVQAGDELIDAPADQAFDSKSVWQRIAIVAAGLVFNLILAAFLYWLLLIIGTTGLKPVIGEPAPNSLAAKASLQAGDTIKSVNGIAISHWQQLHEKLLGGVVEGKPAELLVERIGGFNDTVTLPLNKLNAGDDPGVLFRGLGIEPPGEGDVFVGSVVLGSAAAAAGLQLGDQVISFANKVITGPQQFTQIIEQYGGQTVAMEIIRNGLPQTLSVTPALVQGVSGQCGKLGVGVRAQYTGREQLRTRIQSGPLEAVPAAIGSTFDKAWLTVSMMWRMVTGTISLRHVSGPITIADYAGDYARIGFTAFLSFMALVSISLGVLNLLPVPMLDGGHLMFYAVEVVRGKPVSARIQQAAMAFGLAAVLCLMVLAISNDVRRLVPESTNAAMQSCAWNGQ